jgi:uncharacterized protein YbbC (DUF1343 family)
MKTVTLGLENLIARRQKEITGGRLGLLCNPASIASDFGHAKNLVQQAFPGQLTALFSPQHGFFAEKQDNMIESDDFLDTDLNIPVYSLYGATRIPTAEMMDKIDTLIIDLMDAGTRVYTFTSTVSYCLEVAAAQDKQVIVLDRPNPINGIQVEGNCLCADVASFVGRYPIPMRHGLTMGEYASYINATYAINCRLTIIPMSGWRRAMYFTDTGLPWVAPSPNLPTPASAVVYPGQVIWEGTNVSEGRGTTLPFEQFGAPFIDTRKMLDFMGGPAIPGAVLRPVGFEPTANKWAGRMCRGFQIHVTDPHRYEPYATSLALLQAVIACHPADFAWKQPPYEYEWKKLPVDLIIGSSQIREAIENQKSMTLIRQEWANDLNAFIAATRPFHLYQ